MLGNDVRSNYWLGWGLLLSPPRGIRDILCRRVSKDKLVFKYLSAVQRASNPLKSE
jgi:hypothetical protein